MRRYKRSFTLVELLAVIAIAGVLLGLLAPAFGRMLTGGKLDECAHNIRLGLELAQSHAVSSRKYVAVIFLKESSDDNLKQYCFGGYRLAYVKKDGDNWKFDAWVKNEPWRNPADGAMLVGVVKSRSKTAADLNLGSAAPSTFENPDVEIKEIPSDEKVSAHTAIVFSKLGGVAKGVEPLYFIVTEGKVDGSTYEYGNVDDCLIVKLNPITGRVAFHSEDAGGGE